MQLEYAPIWFKCPNTCSLKICRTNRRTPMSKFGISMMEWVREEMMMTMEEAEEMLWERVG